MTDLMPTVIGGDDERLDVDITGWDLEGGDTAVLEFRDRPDGPVIATVSGDVDIAGNSVGFDIPPAVFSNRPTGHVHHTVTVVPLNTVNGPYTVVSGWLRVRYLQ